LVGAGIAGVSEAAVVVSRGCVKPPINPPRRPGAKKIPHQKMRDNKLELIDQILVTRM
jgi:hypothetical protein